MYYWGVDSEASSDIKAADGVTRRFEALSAAGGKPPEFWGRYIGGAGAMSAGEAAFLHDRACKIVVTYNGATPASVTGDGHQDAEAALAAAKALGIPVGTGVAIYGDVEGAWTPSKDWIVGWSTGIAAGGYRVGIYCKPLAGDAFADAYAAAKADPNVAGAYLWSAHPRIKMDCMAAVTTPPAYKPWVIPGGNSFIWQYGGECFQSVLDVGHLNQEGVLVKHGVDLDLATDEAFAAMW